MLNRGYLATRDALAWFGDNQLEAETYSAAGTSQATASTRLLDRVI
jgi:hypothetical protein